jgi:hypothetical protein
VAPEAAAAAASSGGALLRTLISEREQVVVHRGGPTIEDLVREEIRPLLKAWLDANLPALAERLVRTETSRSYNQAQSDAITEIARTTPGLWKRWTELVDDWSGSPLDNKVARDSLVLHGQVARVDGHFTMPPDQRAPAVMVGKTWAQPPNRPNDRAVLTPWMREWGIPAWAWQGAKVWLSGSNARA